jgi:membrane-associated phospholipid phosphatase
MCGSPLARPAKRAPTIADVKVRKRVRRSAIADDSAVALLFFVGLGSGERSRGGWVAIALAGAALVAGARRARADETSLPARADKPSIEPLTPAPLPAKPPVVPNAGRSKTRSPRVDWTWPKFRVWEYGATAAVWAADIWVRYKEPPPVNPRWSGLNPFDDAVRNWLRGGSESTRAHAVTVSDYLTLSGTAYPYAVDLPVVLFVHREPGVMWQLLMMDLQANAVAGLINNTLYHVAGRARPDLKDCTANPNYDSLCGAPSNNASFPSGHVLTIATATGLVCVDHRYLPIYGSKIADASACALLGVATVATGVARIVADRHFATDGLIGGLIGFGSGYGLPWLLHYRYGRLLREDEVHRVTLLPLAGPDMLGLSVAGIGPF